MMNMNNDRKKLKALETYNIFSSERLGTFPLSPPQKIFRSNILAYYSVNFDRKGLKFLTKEHQRKIYLLKMTLRNFKKIGKKVFELWAFESFKVETLPAYKCRARNLVI